MIENSINLLSARNSLSEFMQQYFDVDGDLLADFVNIFNLVSYPKKSFIIEEKQNIDKVSFIISGLVRVYYHMEGKEITTWLLNENKFFMPVYHIFTGKTNYNNYETLEDTVVLQSTYKQMEEVYNKNILLENMGRKLVQYYYAFFLKMSHSVLFLSAEERYKIFVEDNPELLNRVPLKYIASYLGIKQETLSRIRALK